MRREQSHIQDKYKQHKDIKQAEIYKRLNINICTKHKMKIKKRNSRLSRQTDGFLYRSIQTALDRHSSLKITH